MAIICSIASIKSALRSSVEKQPNYLKDRAPLRGAVGKILRGMREIIPTGSLREPLSKEFGNGSVGYSYRAALRQIPRDGAPPNNPR